MQTVIFGRLADAGGVEVGTFEENVGRFHRHARFLSAKHTADAHRFFGVANHQVTAVEFALHAIQGDERRAFGQAFHHHLLARDFVGIEGMKRLPDFHQHEVGNIDDVINAADAHGSKAVFQPGRRLADFHSADGHARIARTGLRVFHDHFNVQVVIFHLEVIY